MGENEGKWMWHRKKSFFGSASCWLLIVLGLIFLVFGLGYCRVAIEGTAEQFPNNFVPLFVLVSLGLTLVLGGVIGMMCMEISGHAQVIRRLVERATGVMHMEVAERAKEIVKAIEGSKSGGEKEESKATEESSKKE